MIHYELKNPPNDGRGYPRLDLVFYDDGKHPLLADASYWHTASSGRGYDLVNAPPRGKYLRSLCIFLLLAKYRGSVAGKEEKDFHLRDKVLKNSWLATLGTSFGSKKRIAFFKNYFESNAFVTVVRGTGHTGQMKASGAGEPASATYLLKALKFGNFRCFSVPRSSVNATPKLLEGKELSRLAGTLEQYWMEVGKKQKWQKTVEAFVADIDSGRSTAPSTKPKAAVADQSVSQLPFTLSAQWRELCESVKQAMSEGSTGGNWYVICVTPTWLLDWEDIFCNAVIHEGAKVKFAYHAPDAGRCEGVKSQWNMYFKSYAQKGQTAAEYVQKKLLESRQDLRRWVETARAGRKQAKKPRGTFEFYESYIPHPYMAILHTPVLNRKVSGPAWGAPEGTKCMLGLYSMYPDGLEERCGLFLHGPSPMLDLYYKSVVRFFELAPNDEDEYIKLVHR